MSKRFAKWFVFGVVTVAAVYAAIGFARPKWILDAEFARQRALAGATEKEIVAADHRWKILEAGDASKPLVVLVHGFTGSKENWLPMMGGLAENYHVIAVDLPGWGESERKVDADYSALSQSIYLQSFLRGLQQKPRLLVGHSMGGMIVGHSVHANPEIAEKVVLMSSAGVQFEENDFVREVRAGRSPFFVRSAADLHKQISWAFAEPPFIPWPVDGVIAAQRAQQIPFEQKVLAAIQKEIEDKLLQDNLREIQKPVLLLWGEKDRVVDISSVAIFQQQLVNAQSKILPGCGHMPMMEKPQQALDALSAFAH
jgi:abhydrolase domain-containing protein 6